MTSVATGPVHLSARLDAPLSRWLWLVKWLLVLPHVIVLAFLWIAFFVLSIVAFFAILITGRYPRHIFDFTVGVLRWTWRVGYYAYGALGTDRYPPFTLEEVPDYPATLDIAYPEHLSRGLVLVKTWLLAVPHYLVIAFFAGGGSWVVYEAGTAPAGQSATWQTGGGLIGLLTLVAGVVLLFTGRYPRGVFDLLLGMHRWVIRVAAYAALMTDSYPPFRLDLGGPDPAAFAVAAGAPPGTAAPATGGTATGGAPAELAAGPPGTGPPQRSAWSAGRIVTVVIGSVLLASGLATAAAGTAVLVADRAARDADGFLDSPTRRFSAAGYALVFDPVELDAGGSGDPQLGQILGDVRLRAQGVDPDGVFVGIGPIAEVDDYLAGVERERLVDLGPDGRAQQEALAGGPPPTRPGEQPFWTASATGPGRQELIWTAAEGRWTVVVMNADGTRPVVADLSAGVTAPVLGWVWTGLFIGAAVALVVGAVLVLVAVPRRSAPASAPG